MLRALRGMIGRTTPEDDRAELLAVLQTARRLLAQPANDFVWSDWAGRDAALAEIDGLIARITGGDLPPQLEVSVLFAPTGPIQEVSLSSGWAQTFLALGERFDAIERLVWPKEEGGGDGPSSSASDAAEREQA